MGCVNGKDAAMIARDVMTTHELFRAVETDDARSVARMLAEYQVASLPVLDTEGRLRGMVTDRDLCLRILAEGRSFETPIRDVMTLPVQRVMPDTSVEEIESLMRQHRIRHLPVVDHDDRLVGYISLSDLARHCAGSRDEHQLVGVLEAVSPF